MPSRIQGWHYSVAVLGGIIPASEGGIEVINHTTTGLRAWRPVDAVERRGAFASPTPTLVAPACRTLTNGTALAAAWSAIGSQPSGRAGSARGNVCRPPSSHPPQE